MNRFSCCIIAFLFLLSNASYSQGQPMQRLSPDEERKVIETLRKEPLYGFLMASFAYSEPQGAFKDTLTKGGGKTTGLGFSINAGYRLAALPVEFGVNLDFLFYGGSTKNFNYKARVGTILRDVTDTLDISNTMIPASLFARFAPSFGIVQPYAELQAGLNFISASNEFKSYDTKFNSKVTNTSVPFFYGAGVGVAFRIAELIEIPDSRQEILFTIGATYRGGAETTYQVYQLNETTNEVKKIDLKSKTDLLVVNAGFLFRF